MPVREAGTEILCSREETPVLELDMGYSWAIGVTDVPDEVVATEI